MVLDGYVRVSQLRGRSGERFISPALQREQIEGWMRLRGARVGELFEELDVPGAGRERPLLERALARIEAGESDGLVVAHLDRFGRSLLEGLVAIERIQSAGGTFASVNDGFDLATDTGRLVMRVMLSMAEWQRDRMCESWEAAQARAIARGVHLAPVPPTGYRRGEDGRLVVDAAAGPVIGELFARRAQGERVMELARMLEARGVRTPYGASSWAATSVRGVLANRSYLGEVHCGAYMKAGAHEPLTDPQTWERAQAPRQRPVVRARARRPSLLGGLARCAGCRLVLHSHTHDLVSGPRTVYVCGRHSATGLCPAPAIIVSGLLEPHVRGLALARARATNDSGQRARAAAERALAEARAALAGFRDDGRLQLALGRDAYAAGLASRALAVEDAQRQLSAQPPAASQLAAAGAEARWEAMDVPERRLALGELIDAVIVHRGHGRPSERVWICWAGEAPTDLPRGGHRQRTARSFTPPGGWAVTAEAGRRGRRWSQTRLERELRAQLAGATAFPAPGELEAAGAGELLAQLERRGGARVWAARLGLSQPPNRHYERWDEPRIGEALAVYLEGAAAWPTRRAFSADGLAGLASAIQRSGGTARWASEFGLEPARVGRGSPPQPAWRARRARTPS